MEFENLLTLIKTVSDSELTDFDYEENGTRIRLKKKKETVVVSGTSSNVPVMGLQTVQPLGQITESEAKMEKDIADGEPEGMLIKSPLVGTFYAAPAEDADPFVSVGDQVKKGQTLAIVEAMKLMNEIESDFDGKVAEIYVENGQAVAEFLEKHPKVAYVNYPGLPSSKYYERARKYLPHGGCGVVSFGLKGGREAASAFMQNLKLGAIETHVADARTCCLNPATSTHRQMTDEQLKEAGVPAELIRISLGLEDKEDLIADISNALDAIRD